MASEASVAAAVTHFSHPCLELSSLEWIQQGKAVVNALQLPKRPVEGKKSWYCLWDPEAHILSSCNSMVLL